MQNEPSYFDEQSCDPKAFEALIDQTLLPASVPTASQIVKNIPVYDVAKLTDQLANDEMRRALMGEWATVLGFQSGVFVLKRAYSDTTAIDAATQIFDDVIEREKSQKGGGEDHFAASGANDRIWNSLQKLCEASPEIFLNYFANVALDTACEAWLGPNYQMTAQVNLVHPGGAAQQAHRDYHLGFQTQEQSGRYPAHVHDLSPVLTLQGAVAHCDMPIESGPTKLLPFSQLFRPGYMAWRREEFRDLFEARFVQVALEKGDAIFFNPALFHAAGANTSTGIHRMANLLQVSSAFGRAMETIDRVKMSAQMYPFAQAAMSQKRLSCNQIQAAIANCAEGYPFPTNLDNDPPKGGLAPESQAQLFRRALSQEMSPEDFAAELERQSLGQLS